MNRILSIALAFLAFTSFAQAHAFLDHADPKVGSEIPSAPTQIKIWYTEELEPAFSVIEVLDESKHRVDSKDTHVDKKDPHLLIVSIPKLAPGTYTVSWHVVATDTHRTQGTYPLTVKP